ncbi:MAG: HEAT repeat domain-containing protein [Eubacteriales bacterium]|nr:HEAT repeat domain-containing protein [Eubacteriales bacterium]
MFGSKESKIEKAIAKNQPEAIIKLLNDKDKATVLSAIKGLGSIKLDDSFNALVPLLNSPDKDYRAAAAESLGNIGNEHAKAFMLHATSIEKEEDVKKVMENACSKLKEHHA